MTRNFEILQDKQIQFRKEIGFLLKSQINEGEEMSGGGADEIVREWGTERVVINEEREREKRNSRKERKGKRDREKGGVSNFPLSQSHLTFTFHQL